MVASFTGARIETSAFLAATGSSSLVASFTGARIETRTNLAKGTDAVCRVLHGRADRNFGKFECKTWEYSRVLHGRADRNMFS